MDNKRKLVGVMAVFVAVLFVGMAMPTSAHHDHPKDKEHKDGNDNKIKYISFGIGDHIVICPGGLGVTVFPNGLSGVQVIVTDPSNENTELFNETIPVGPIGPFPIGPLPDGTCLGGAFENTVDTNVENLTIENSWQVWAEDKIFNLIRDLDELDPNPPNLIPDNTMPDIVPSMFARYTAEAHKTTLKSAKDPSTCVPQWSGTRICEDDTFTFETQFKVLAQMSVCGKGGTTDILSGDDDDPSTDAWDELAVQKLGAGHDKTDLDYDTYELTKSVFVNGPVFFSLDCGSGGALIKPTYDDFVHWYNNDPENPTGGLFTGLPPPNATIDGDEYGSTCNPGLPTGGFVCLFELPVGGAHCWSEGNTAKGADPWSAHHEVLPGTLGYIGWNHDDAKATGNLDCLEPNGQGPWTKTISDNNGDPTNFVIQGFPVEVNFLPAP